MFQCHFFRENHHSKIYLSSTENLIVKNMRNLMYCIYLQETQNSSLTEDLIEDKSCGQQPFRQVVSGVPVRAGQCVLTC